MSAWCLSLIYLTFMMNFTEYVINIIKAVKFLSARQYQGHNSYYIAYLLSRVVSGTVSYGVRNKIIE
jgi:hypothetical protein